MTNIIYLGANGQILVDSLILTDKSGSGECLINAAPSGAWTAKGFKNEYEVVTSSAFAFRKDSGKTYSNNGAVGVSQVILPTTPGAGITLTFVRTASQPFRVKPQSPSTIIYSGGQMAAGEYLELASDGAALSVVSDSNDNWIAIIEKGTLTEEIP